MAEPGTNEPSPRRSGLRRALLLGAVFAAGVLAGATGSRVGPALARAIGIVGQTDHRGPLWPALWGSRSGQFSLLDPAVKSPSLVYVGDSITDWINVEEYVRMAGGQVLNRAIAGDTADAALQRIRGSFPRDVLAAVVLLGYNDVSQGTPPERIVADIRALCDLLIHEYGVSHVVVESLLPSTDPRRSEVIAEINQRLAVLAGESISYLDLVPAFCSGNRQDASLFVDGVHLSAAGAARRAQLEVMHLNQVLALSGHRFTVAMEED